MSRTRHVLAAVLAGVALAAAGCGGDEEDQPGGKSDAPVNTDTPAQNDQTTPAPAGSDEETRTTRTDGE